MTTVFYFKFYLFIMMCVCMMIHEGGTETSGSGSGRATTSLNQFFPSTFTRVLGMKLASAGFAGQAPLPVV